MRALAALIAICLIWPVLADAQEDRQTAWSGAYPEGPVWIDGTLYWAEMSVHAVMAWDGSGKPAVFFDRAGCGPTAIARYKTGDLIILCHLDGSLAHVDTNGDVRAIIRQSVDGIALRNPNDASSDSKGGVWFTDPGTFSVSAPSTGAVYYLSPDGTLTRHVTGLSYGNGVHVDRQNARLLVSEHLARQVLDYPIQADGTLGAAEVLFRLDDFGLPKPRYPESGPDGLEIGPDGTLWVAEYGAARLLGWRADRGLVAALVVDAPYITNIAFGPRGLVAITGSKDNRTPPFPGVTWVFPAQALADAIVE